MIYFEAFVSSILVKFWCFCPFFQQTFEAILKDRNSDFIVETDTLIDGKEFPRNIHYEQN
jgi:hypothetical protein